MPGGGIMPGDRCGGIMPGDRCGGIMPGDMCGRKLPIGDMPAVHTCQIFQNYTQTSASANETISAIRYEGLTWHAVR